MFERFNQQILLAAGLALLALALLAVKIPVSAAPAVQVTPFPTPTPGPDGRIVYTVQPGESLWVVSAKTGVSMDEIRRLNDMAPDEIFVQEGQELLIGFGGPSEVTPTAGSSPTPEPLLPTPSPQPGSGTLCILVFNDQNGDSQRQEEELSIPGGRISVSDRLGEVSFTEDTTTGGEPQCFEELPEGDYNVTVAIPDGFNPTTVLNYALNLAPGSETHIRFGAQMSSEKITESQTPSGSSRSPLLGVIGVLFLLGGVGLGIFAGRLGGRKDKRAEDENSV